MSWNYRVIKHHGPKDTAWYGIHEVYYSRRGEIDAWAPREEIMAKSLRDLWGMLRDMADAVAAASEHGNPRRVLDEAEMPGEK